MTSRSHIYAGVAGYFGRAGQEGLTGVFRRATDGEAWEHVIKDKETFTVSVHPRDANVVFAGTNDGVYRSTDRGAHFQRTNFPDHVQVWSVLVDPSDPNIVYAGASPIAVYRSEDGGESFRRMPDPGMPDRAVMPFACRVMRMAPHPRHAGELYATLEVNGVMHSKDGGESWRDCSADLIRLAQQPHLKSKIVSDTENEGMLDGHAICTSAADPDAVIVAVRMGLFRSTDAGQHWQDMEVGRFSPTTYGRDIKVSPQDPNTLYAALSVAASSKDGAVYRSTDVGKSWQRFDKVQVHGTIMSVALHQNDPRQVYIGARYDGEIFGTQDGGETWQSMNLPHGVKDIYSLACG